MQNIYTYTQATKQSRSEAWRSIVQLPASPFEEEKCALGQGFLTRIPFRARSKPDLRFRGERRPHLTEEQKLYIGSTGRETPIRELAEQFGIGEAYVAKLR